MTTPPTIDADRARILAYLLRLERARQRAPSLTRMARDLGLSYTTAHRRLTSMATDGLIIWHPSRGAHWMPPLLSQIGRDVADLGRHEGE